MRHRERAKHEGERAKDARGLRMKERAKHERELSMRES